jgi:hypothetical protein
MKFFAANLFLLLFFFLPAAQSQNVERVYRNNIQSIQFHTFGNQQGFPAYSLNGREQLFLSFDDLEGNVKSYYYTYVLCDYNWKPVNLNPFDYIKGFTQNRLTTYRYSSLSLTRYTHYQAVLPERGSVPTRSGNYILKVYLDGDSTKLVFTKQMVVVDEKSTITAAIVQPFTPQLFSTHQKVRFSALINGINSFSAAQQVKVVILQNNNWNTAQRDIPPTFVRGNTLEYNSENIAVFPAGKEWRWLDLRSLRLQSDRVERGIYGKSSTDIFMKPDADRSSQRYVYFPDFNGMFHLTTYESINPLWQGDYATVHFSFVNESPMRDDIYLYGQFTGYQLDDRWKMKLNDSTGLYENTAFLKQGYYNYAYVARNSGGEETRNLEGNYWETENSYTILIYYKAFNDRSDQLIGISQINSRTDKPGFSF